MKLSRNWVTPATAGLFLIVAVTGVLMFFHAERPQGKALHEWMGWGLVLVAVLHIILNWKALKAQLSRRLGLVIAGIFAVLLALALVPLPGAEHAGVNPIRGILSSLGRAPVKVLAQAAGRELAPVLADLKEAGLPEATADSTLEALTGKDQERQVRALGAIFR